MERGYVVKERGVIYVKGKGDMNTCFVMGRKIWRARPFGQTVNQGNSLAEVVYGMVRARKRRTGKRGEHMSVPRMRNSGILRLHPDRVSWDSIQDSSSCAQHESSSHASVVSHIPCIHAATYLLP
jgi:hypothetical protein